MKFVKKLMLGDRACKIVSESVVLDLTSPGRAVFCIQADSAETGTPVRFFLGFDGTAELWFTGYVESVRKLDAKQLRITAREFSAVLSRRWTLSQRHTSARRVLEELSDRTGAAFRLGDSAEWADAPIPYFFNIGSGFSILELIGRHLRIADFVWRGQPDGSVYVGSASELAGAGSTLAIPERFFTGVTATGADCACLPALRPGRQLRIGGMETVRIESITLAGAKMRLGFGD